MFKAQDHSHIFDQIKDHPRKFPIETFTIIKVLDLLPSTLPNTFGKSHEFSSEPSQELLELLFELGRGDLSVGRIIEGHINALLLIDTFGSLKQKKEYFEFAAQGNLFGVWNTEIDKENLKINNKGKKRTLTGAKSFCTGALNLQFAVITGKNSDGVQMVIVPINENRDLIADWSLWNPIGMRASVSCRIDFSGVVIKEGQFLGRSGDYFKEPYFSWGGVRFSAIQLGGAQNIADIVLKELTKRKRTSDPYQKWRLGKMAILMETAQLWISKASIMENTNNDTKRIRSQNKVNYANMMRSITLDICEEIISIAEKAVGVQGTMTNHPLEKPIRDLRVYLKQAGPDGALANVGNFIAKKKK